MASLMKGHTFAKGKHKLAYPATAEYKLDEIRLDVRREGNTILYQSYADKPLHNLTQFSGPMLELMVDIERDRLDMGVLVDNNFSDTYRYVRSKNGAPSELLGAQIQLVLFDVPGYGALPYNQRKYLCDEIKDNAWNNYGLPFVRPIRVEVDDEDMVFKAYANAVSVGYEGLMVKSSDHAYELGKRSYGWLKVKPEEDADGIITAVNQAISITGVPLDRAGSVTITLEDGSSADCGGIAHDLGRAMLVNPSEFVGQWATFTYMMRDRQCGYRHPRFQRLREAKA